MVLTVIPITAEITELAQLDEFVHACPADRLIGATEMANNVGHQVSTSWTIKLSMVKIMIKQQFFFKLH